MNITRFRCIEPCVFMGYHFTPKAKQRMEGNLTVNAKFVQPEPEDAEYEIDLDEVEELGLQIPPYLIKL